MVIAFSIDIFRRFIRKKQSPFKFTSRSRRRAWTIDNNKQLFDMPWIFNDDPTFYDYDSPIWSEQTNGKWYAEDTGVEYTPGSEVFENDDNFFDCDPIYEVPHRLNDIIDFEIVIPPTENADDK